MKDRDAISEGLDEVLDERDSSPICVCGDPKHERESECCLDDDSYWDDDKWADLRDRSVLPHEVLAGSIQDRIGPTSGSLAVASGASAVAKLERIPIDTE